MRFLLINPNVDSSIAKDSFAIKAEVPPLGLLYIAGALEEKGHEVEIIDFCVEEFKKETLKKALKNTDAVGITTRSHGIKIIKELAQNIRQINKKIPIILGGPYTTLEKEKSLEYVDADISVEGDGEETIVEIAEYLNGEKKLSEISGIYYKQGNKIQKGKPAKIIMDLDKIPFPSRHLIEKYTYGIVNTGLKLTHGKVTSIMISRGCPYHCRYCINRAITKKYRTRTAENVIEEIKQIQGKYDFLHIVDDNFFVDKENANKILDYLIENKTKLEVWISGIRVDAASKELFKKMKKAGVTTINMGIESGNQEVLDYFEKQTTIQQIKNATKTAHKNGFLTIGYFIIGSPIETKKHIEKTIKFAKKLPIDMAIFSPFGYIKGSPIWEEAYKAGKIQEHEYTATSNSKRGLGNFTEEELWEHLIKAFRDFYLRPTYILRQIGRAIRRRDFRIIKSGYRLLRSKNNMLKADINELNQLENPSKNIYSYIGDG